MCLSSGAARGNPEEKKTMNRIRKKHLFGNRNNIIGKDKKAEKTEKHEKYGEAEEAQRRESAAFLKNEGEAAGRIKIFGVKISCLDMEETVEKVIGTVINAKNESAHKVTSKKTDENGNENNRKENKNKKYKNNEEENEKAEGKGYEGKAVFTPNAIMLNTARKDSHFRRILNSSVINTADGMGVVAAARVLCNANIRRVSGVDVGHRLMREMAKRGMGLYLFGGKGGVAQSAADKIALSYPGLRICGFLSGYGYPDDTAHIIKNSGADIAFVCLGSPLQEEWIYQNAQRAPGCVFIGLGGSMDVYAGDVVRAPCFISASGFEWAYRMLTEPKRLRRLPQLIGYALAVMKEKTKKIFGKTDANENDAEKL